MVYGFTCYYDASSKEEVHSRPLVLAGLAAPTTKWEQLEIEWATTLADEKIDYFDSSACSGLYREYSAWRERPEVRDEFLDRLSAIIAKTVSLMVCAWMRPADFHAVNNEYALDRGEFSQSPYEMLALLGSTHVDDRLNSSPFITPGFHTAHIVEYGDAGQGRMRHLIQRGLVPLSTARKWDKKTGHKIHAFAACDLVGYYVARALERENKPPRTLGKNLQDVPTYLMHADVTKLTRMCEMYPQDFPRREPQP